MMIRNTVLYGIMLHDWTFWTLIGIVLLLSVFTMLIFVLLWRHGITWGAQQKTKKTKRNYSGIHSDLRRLQRHLGNNKSSCPMFLVLGDTLPKSVQTVFTEYDGKYLEATQLDFHFFERGVLIVPKIDLAAQGTVEHGIYDNLFRELLRIRPQRPLDGVVLSISIDTVRQTEEAGRVAAHLHEQLILLQQVTGMRLPVHLLFHDCEKLTGFHELRQIGNTSNIFDTLGWNPAYTKYREWRNDWLHEAQQSISAQLQRIRIIVFSGVTIQEEQESQNLFLLTDELNRLQPGLIQFCNYIFSRSVYHEPFIFHGLAFGGTITSGDTVADGTEVNGTQTQRFIFAHRLLRESLPEGAVLAIPIRQIFQARTRTVRIVQIFCTALLVFWGCGML
jgi:type VI secretion system protein ImpL